MSEPEVIVPETSEPTPVLETAGGTIPRTVSSPSADAWRNHHPAFFCDACHRGRVLSAGGFDAVWLAGDGIDRGYSGDDHRRDRGLAADWIARRAIALWSLPLAGAAFGVDASAAFIDGYLSFEFHGRAVATWPLLPAAGLLIVPMVWFLGGLGSGRLHPVLMAHLLLVVFFQTLLVPHLVLQRSRVFVGDVMDSGKPGQMDSMRGTWFKAVRRF